MKIIDLASCYKTILRILLQNNNLSYLRMCVQIDICQDEKPVIVE